MTYYVVAHTVSPFAHIRNISTNTKTDTKTGNKTLRQTALLPAGASSFEDLNASKGKIKTQYIKKSGIYLFTNKVNGKQ